MYVHDALVDSSGLEVLMNEPKCLLELCFIWEPLPSSSSFCRARSSLILNHEWKVTFSRLPGVSGLVSAAWCQQPDVSSLVSAAWCQRSGVSGLVSAVWCQRSGGSSLMSAICCCPHHRNFTCNLHRSRIRRIKSSSHYLQYHSYH